MKLHITNIYGIQKTFGLRKKQDKIASVAKEIGFLEMGLYRYNVDTDSDEQLSSRLDGVIAALEPQDIVVLQLPTGNGERFETRLISKICAYRDTKLVLLFHDLSGYSDLSKYQKADCILAQSGNMLRKLREMNIGNGYGKVVCLDEDTDPLFAKKTLLEVVSDLSATADTTQQGTMFADDPDMIHVGFGLYDKYGTYSSYVGVVMASILDHTESKVCFHVLIDQSVSQLNQQRLGMVARERGSYVQFHKVNVDKKNIEEMNPYLARYSIGSIFRLFIPDLMPELHKILYLDADLMFVRDIKELWDVDVTDYALAGVYDFGFERGFAKPEIIKNGSVELKEYINSGVLVMNLDQIRAKGNLFDLSAEFMASGSTSSLPDQDALNYIFRKRILHLKPHWNVYTRYHRKECKTLGNVVYHYMGENYINFSNPTEYDKLYVRYRMNSPWGYEVMEAYMLRGIHTMTDKGEMLQKLMQRVSNPNTIRVFYGEPVGGMYNFMQIVQPKQGDLFMQAHENDFAKEKYGCKVVPFESIHEMDKQTYVIIVVPEADHCTAIQKLDEAGWKNGIDYFAVPRLLFQEQGGYWA